jgi:2'-5' RNA ligase superfamily
MLETCVTLVLADGAPELAEAHDELYPERILEHIPLSLTLLYPFVPRDSLREEHLETLRGFFAARGPLEFDLVRLAEFPGLVIYAVPEPEDELRATLRGLWALFPAYPPYGESGGDPPPHATLAQLGDDPDAVREAVRRRVEPLLPVHFVVHEASLLEAYEPDRFRPRESFPFGG